MLTNSPLAWQPLGTDQPSGKYIIVTMQGGVQAGGYAIFQKGITRTATGGMALGGSAEITFHKAKLPGGYSDWSWLFEKKPQQVVEPEKVLELSGLMAMPEFVCAGDMKVIGVRVLGDVSVETEKTVIIIRLSEPV